MTKPLLPMTWDVPQEFRDRLGDKVGRQRTMQADEHLLLVVHRPPGPDDVERIGRFFWRKPDGSWSSSDLGAGTTALLKHCNEFEQLVQQYERLEDDARDVEDHFQIIQGVTPLARTARNLHAVLQEARQACPDDRDLLNVRDRAYELERNTELLLADAKNAVEFQIARKAEQQTDEAHRMSTSAHRLNILASFFFPLVTLAAVFGTNLRHGLEERDAPYPFLVLLLAGLMAGCFLQWTIRPAPDMGTTNERER